MGKSKEERKESKGNRFLCLMAKISRINKKLYSLRKKNEPCFRAKNGSERGKTYRVQSRSQLIVTSSHKIHETRKRRLQMCRQFFSRSFQPRKYYLDLNVKIMLEVISAK